MLSEWAGLIAISSCLTCFFVLRFFMGYCAFLFGLIDPIWVRANNTSNKTAENWVQTTNIWQQTTELTQKNLSAIKPTARAHFKRGKSKRARKRNREGKQATTTTWKTNFSSFRYNGTFFKPIQKIICFG